MEKIIISIEDSFSELFALESIIKLTKEACLEREFASIYYELEEKSKTALSEERNHYINMLTIALDKLSNLKQTIHIAEYEAGKLKQNSDYCSRKITA